MNINVFTDERKQPGDGDLRKKLGKSYKLFEETVISLQFDEQGIVFEWKFSKTAGWYLIVVKKKRRIFYFIPKERDFSFRIIFGGKAVSEIKKGDIPKPVKEMVAKAKKYPEGTLCEFDKSNYDVATILKLLKIKIEN
jgi:hypothetical protein